MKQSIGLIIAAVAGFLPLVTELQAAPLSARDRQAIRLHERRAIERRALQRSGQPSSTIEQQRSRPIPPVSPNSQVVPNR